MVARRVVSFAVPRSCGFAGPPAPLLRLPGPVVRPIEPAVCESAPSGSGCVSIGLGSGVASRGTATGKSAAQGVSCGACLYFAPVAEWAAERANTLLGSAGNYAPSAAQRTAGWQNAACALFLAALGKAPVYRRRQAGPHLVCQPPADSASARSSGLPGGGLLPASSGVYNGCRRP